MTHRHLLLLGTLIIAAAAPSVLSAQASAKASDLTIVRVFTGWRDAESFKRISEYFTGRENTGGEEMIRSQPELRAGYYFLIRTTNSGAAIAAKINLQLILPSNTKLQNYSFPVDLHTGDTVLNLGLTGDNWPNPKANPVAWKLDFIAADGHVLASEKSYLWEKPLEK